MGVPIRLVIIKAPILALLPREEIALAKVENRGSVLTQIQRLMFRKILFDTLANISPVGTYSIAVKYFLKRGNLAVFKIFRAVLIS